MDLNRQPVRVVEERHLLPKVPKLEEEPNGAALLRAFPLRGRWQTASPASRLTDEVVSLPQ